MPKNSWTHRYIITYIFVKFKPKGQIVKLQAILLASLPDRHKFSALLRKFAGNSAYMNDLKDKLEYK